jgi:FeS assembly protein IscX
MDWNDAEDIGLALFEASPELDPLTVRFTDLHQMVMELPGFEGKPNESREARLEAIQMAWLDEYRSHR